MATKESLLTVDVGAQDSQERKVWDVCLDNKHIGIPTDPKVTPSY